MRTPIQEAQQLASWGFNVLPAPPGGKAPRLKWTQFQNERTDSRLGAWFGDRPSNYWVMTGRMSGIVVLDCDTPGAEEYWREQLGEQLDSTTRVATRKGHHYYFRIGPDETVNSWSYHEGDIGYDLRAEGAGVIAPPSVHETGFVYTWEVGIESILPMPEQLRGAGGAGGGSSSGGGTRSILAQLLADPKKQGDRNNWMSRVAGHYAKLYRTQRDAFEVHCRMAGSMLQPPLAEEELLKTIGSIWKAEQSKGMDADSPNPAEENGWLVGGDRCLLTLTKSKDPDSGVSVSGLARWGDFDIRALGVVDDESGAERVYDVEVLRERQADSRRALLPARKLSDPRALAGWLAEFGVTVMPPENTWPRSGNVSNRLTRYVESQRPPHFQVVNALGWDGHGFITHEGVIRADGLHGHEGKKPDPTRRDWSPYRYGFVAESVARRVLQRVLSFHDETVTAVFGAWWAACLIKPQLQTATSLFPFMALEAPSESGKSSGFFSLMLQLAGNAQGNVNPTFAALRDYISAHRSGLVWIDDLNDPDRLMELLRQATGEGSVAKKGEDRHSTESVQLVAPICLSGEALNLRGQKALIDRAVMLDVPSPTDRCSLYNPEVRQWNDVVALREEWNGDLTAVAGTLVMLALRGADEAVASVPGLMTGQAGRWSEKVAILKAGAALLDCMLGAEGTLPDAAGVRLSIAERVDQWVAELAPDDGENTLTLQLIPAALAQYGWPDHPSSSSDPRWPQTPAFVHDGTVWFSVGALATWWYQHRSGRVEQRTETADALLQQTRALGLGGGSSKSSRQRGNGRKRFRLEGSGESWYFGLDRDQSEAVMGRSRGRLGVAERGPKPSSSARSSSEQLDLELPAYHTIEDLYRDA